MRKQRKLLKTLLNREDEPDSETDDKVPELCESSFFIREEYVLAHTNNVDLVETRTSLVIDI
jgi:hypothetical protein